MISEHSKQAADKLAPTSQSTVPTLQGSCSIGTYGEEKGYNRTTNENKEVSAVIFPLLLLSWSCNSK